MRMCGLIFRIIIYVTFLAGAFLLLFVAFFPSYRELLLQYIYILVDRPAILAIAGAVLIAIWLFGIAPLAGGNGGSSIPAFRTENGQVDVSLNAVKEFTAQICRGIPGISEVNGVIPIRQGNGIAGVKIALILSPGAQAPQVTTQCQEKIIQKLKQTFGFEEVHRVDVRFDWGKASTSKVTFEPNPNFDMFPAFKPEQPPPESGDSLEKKLSK